jgi:hypothetical protein
MIRFDSILYIFMVERKREIYSCCFPSPWPSPALKMSAEIKCCGRERGFSKQICEMPLSPTRNMFTEEWIFSTDLLNESPLPPTALYLCTHLECGRGPG